MILSLSLCQAITSLCVVVIVRCHCNTGLIVMGPCLTVLATNHCSEFCWWPHPWLSVPALNARLPDVFSCLLSSFSGESRSVNSERWKSGIGTTRTGY